MKITSSGTKTTFDRVEQFVKDGRQLANITDLVMDKQFIEKARHDWCWLDYKDLPNQIGWYQIDRNNKVLTKIEEEQAKKLEWHERLFIYESAQIAAKGQSILALYIGDEYDDARLSALYLCGPDVLAWAALSEK
jgi:hypothetical protein